MAGTVDPPVLAREEWGLLPYARALERQNERVAARIGGAIPDSLAFVEHSPVYTIGRRRSAEQNLIAPPEFICEHGIEVVRTNRGGDITYHGPGQIVGYLFFDLRPKRDLHAILRIVESSLIAVLADLGLAGAETRKGMTGVWFQDRKVAAIGMAARQWITFHGFALNHSPDLSHFSGIVPCGISEGSVTSLVEECRRTGAPIPSIHACKNLIHTRLRAHLVNYAG